MPDSVEIIERPWGVLKTLEQQEGYLVKEITVPPGKQCSLHLHRQHDEHWVVVSGEGKAVIGDKVVDISPNVHVHIPPHTPHRVINSGSILLCYIEVVYGDGSPGEDLEKLDATYDVL
jgi:mannose-1-phosphate guanylyltransferase / mannose-6-phosphate isomerase